MLKAALALAIVVLFWIANRAAFEGFFSDDDLDNLSWATVAGLDSFLRELVSPLFSPTNTRPTGALVYRWLGPRFELWLPLLFTLHLSNAALVFTLLTRLELPAFPATLFFTFHTALLEAWWKPMYIFDLLAATFCLLTWLLFLTRFWPAALLTFWLAYKSKEVALFFPVVLAFHHWRHALPFFLISASFGLQALIANQGRDNPYTLRFSLSSLAVTVPFYAKHFVLNKYGALLLAPLALYSREPILWRSLAAFLLLLLPLLFLPGRLFSVYLYVPLLGLLPGLAAVMARVPRPALVLGLTLFLGLDYLALRDKRRRELALGHESRAYFTQLRAAAPLPSTAYYENAPLEFRLHGIRGALRLVTGDPNARVLNPELEADRQAATSPLPTLHWFRPTQTLSVRYHQYGETTQSTLNFADASAAWQLMDGWHDREGHFRWASPRARLRLLAEPTHTQLAVHYNLGPALLAATGPLTVELLLNGVPLGRTVLNQPGTPTLSYPLPAPLSGPVIFELRSSPGYTPPGDGRSLGIALLSVGLR